MYNRFSKGYVAGAGMHLTQQLRRRSGRTVLHCPEVTLSNKCLIFLTHGEWQATIL
jgi:hypothetical protein